jgi:hypothetical protein
MEPGLRQAQPERVNPLQPEQTTPLTLSLPKGLHAWNQGFDKLSPNGGIRFSPNGKYQPNRLSCASGLRSSRRP